MTTIYGLTDLATGEVRYVGRTSKTIELRRGRHVWQARGKSGSCQRYVSRWIRSLDYRIGVIALETEVDDAVEAEQRWIDLLTARGARLTNTSSAKTGAPPDGRPHSVQHRERMTGRKLPPEWRAAISRGQQGRTLSPEQKERLRLANTGRKATPEARAKMSAARKGVPKSEATKAKMKLASQARGTLLRGIPLSAEHRARISSSTRGKAKSAVHAERVRQARRARAIRGDGTKLSPSIVEEIRARYQNEKIRQRDLAEAYGVTQTTISSVLRGKTWSYV